MNISDDSIKILVVGKGAEFFKSVREEFKGELESGGKSLDFSLGFSAPEVTNIMITIGIGVVTTVSAHFLTKFIESVFSAKEKAKEGGVNTTVNITIVNGDRFINVAGEKAEIINKIIECKNKSDSQ